jgi:hypothetical protein
MRLRSARYAFLTGAAAGVLICNIGLGSASAGNAGQFYAYFGEAASSEQGKFCYLACRSVMLRLPQVWLVDLDGDRPAQPVPYAPFSSDCPDSVWKAWERLAHLEGKRTELRGLEGFDLEIHLRADSVGVDTLCDGTTFRGVLVAESAGGAGTISLTMFCDTLIRIRGMYQLPARPERIVFITYKGTACECQEVDLPVVIYPK